MAQDGTRIIRTLLVDPDPEARERLGALLRHHADVEVAGECADGAAALEAIAETVPDLVFMEVQLPGVDAFGVLRDLGAGAPPVVFVTSGERHALRAFEVHALDFLLKPVSAERLARSVERARGHLGGRSERELERRLDEVLGGLKSRPVYPARLTVRSGTRVSFVNTAEIDWVQAEANYARLHTGGRSLMARETMAGLEARLDPALFVRIHRSTIVRVAFIREVDAAAPGEFTVILQDGTRLPSSRTYRRRLVELIGLTP